MADSLKLVSGGDVIKIWGLPELRLTHTFKPLQNAASSLTWSPNNNFLASTALGDPIVVTSFNKSTPTSIELQGCEDDTCVAFNSSSRHLLTAGKSKILNLWDLKTRTIKKKIKSHSDAVNCVTFNWNDTNIASGTTGGDILVHSVSTTVTSTPLRLPQTQAIHAIQYSRFKKALLGSVSDDGALNTWDTNTKKIVASFPDEHTAPAMALSFSPMNDMLLATVGLDKRIIFYDIVGKKVIKDMQAESPLTSVAFMQDGAAFAVGTTRGKIHIYDLRAGSSPLHTTVAHQTAVHCVACQLPPKGSNSSSSATLAAKLTSRSATEAAAKKAGPPPLPPGIPGTPKTSEPAQNGVQLNEGNDIISPVREGSNASLTKDVESDDYYEPINSKRPDSIAAASGIFSPISSSTQSHHPPTTKSISDPTPVLNGHPPATASSHDDAVPRVARQPRLPNSTSQVFEKASSSATIHPPGTSSGDNRKSTLARKVSSDKQSLAGTTQVKPLPSPPQRRPVETSTSLTSQHSDNVSSKVGEMTSASLTNSREALNGFIQPANVEGASDFHEYQIQFMKNLIDDSLDEFRINFHEDIVNLQVEMLRQFQIQQNEMKALLQQYSLNDALVAENEKLREEIKKLKSTH